MRVVIYLIRHGRTEGNEEKRYIGRTQEHLSERGILGLTSGKTYPEVSLLFSGAMLRCVETCECIYPGQPIRKIEDFREIDFGDFEGKNYQELSSDPRYQAWIDSGGTMTFPAGEDREAFISVCVRGFGRMLDEIRKTAREETAKEHDLKAAAVMHGGTIMAILSREFGGDYYDYQVPNGEGYLLRVEADEKGHRILEVKRLRFDDGDAEHL